MGKLQTFALVGEKGAGKDSLALNLQASADFEGKSLINLKFAEPLHCISSQVFGAVHYSKRELKQIINIAPTSKLAVALHALGLSDTLVSKCLEQANSVFMKHRDVDNLGGESYNITWRLFNQLLGTEVIRAVVGDDFFIKHLEQTRDGIAIITFGKLGFVITDARFDNELKAATGIVGIVRGTNSRTSVNLDDHESEHWGQRITVAATDIRLGHYEAVETLARYCQSELGVPLVGIQESNLDADGEVYFTEIWSNAQ